MCFLQCASCQKRFSHSGSYSSHMSSKKCTPNLSSPSPQSPMLDFSLLARSFLMQLQAAQAAQQLAAFPAYLFPPALLQVTHSIIHTFIVIHSFIYSFIHSLSITLLFIQCTHTPPAYFTMFYSSQVKRFISM